MSARRAALWRHDSHGAVWNQAWAKRGPATALLSKRYLFCWPKVIAESWDLDSSPDPEPPVKVSISGLGCSVVCVLCTQCISISVWLVVACPFLVRCWVVALPVPDSVVMLKMP